MGSEPALRVRGLSVSYDGVPAVCDVSLDVAQGQVLAVLGPSGCGKSTLLRAVAGLEQATGTVTWDGTDVSRRPTHKRGFALMFQDGQLFPQLSVAANVGYPLRIRRTPGRTARVAALLDLVGLSDLAGRYPCLVDSPAPAAWEGEVRDLGHLPCPLATGAGAGLIGRVDRLRPPATAP